MAVFHGKRKPASAVAIIRFLIKILPFSRCNSVRLHIHYYILTNYTVYRAHQAKKYIIVGISDIIVINPLSKSKPPYHNGTAAANIL